MTSSINAITLRCGVLEFSARTCGSGPTVLCLHGFPDHAGSFRFQLPALAAAGFRGVAPTLRGYEPSSQPADRDYHVVRMAEDVVSWIDALGEERVHLVGHDWGAIISYAAAALAPDRLLSLTTMAIPHLGGLRDLGLRTRPSQLIKSAYILLFQMRGVAEFVLEARDWALVEWLWRRWSPGWEVPPSELSAIKRSFEQPGVKHAVLAYYRALTSVFPAAAKETRRLLGAKTPVPTLALTGALDGCMDTRLHDDAMREEYFGAGFEVVRIADAGHFLHQEKPEEVNRRLLEWLGDHPA